MFFSFCHKNSAFYTTPFPKNCTECTEHLDFLANSSKDTPAATAAKRREMEIQSETNDVSSYGETDTSPACRRLHRRKLPPKTTSFLGFATAPVWLFSCLLPSSRTAADSPAPAKGAITTSPLALPELPFQGCRKKQNDGLHHLFIRRKNQPSRSVFLCGEIGIICIFSRIVRTEK